MSEVRRTSNGNGTWTATHQKDEVKKGIINVIEIYFIRLWPNSSPAVAAARRKVTVTVGGGAGGSTFIHPSDSFGFPVCFSNVVVCLWHKNTLTNTHTHTHGPAPMEDKQTVTNSSQRARHVPDRHGTALRAKENEAKYTQSCTYTHTHTHTRASQKSKS